MNIGFIYTKFHPVTSSASVHGYQLVKGFRENGHTVYTIGVGKNDYSIDYPKSILGLIKFISKIDIVYIRINPWLVNDWFTLIKILTFGKVKVVWEINAPVEEVLSGHGGNPSPSILKWVNKQNRKRKFLSKFCDLSISVSEVLKNYSLTELKIKNSQYVPNGSDPDLFYPREKDSNNPLFSILKDKFVVVWAGNAETKWQGLDLIYEAAKYFNEHNKDVYFLIISNVSAYNTVVLPNVLSISEVNYKILPEFLSYGDVALCVYKDYDWCKYGFYNSPLKMFDYMSMGLPIIGSKIGQIKEVLSNKSSCTLINYNKDELIESIKKMKYSCLEYKNFGIELREELVDKYTWKKTANSIGIFFEQLN